MTKEEIKVGDSRKIGAIVAVAVRLTEKSVIYRMVYPSGTITNESNMTKNTWLKRGVPF